LRAVRKARRVELIRCGSRVTTARTPRMITHSGRHLAQFRAWHRRRGAS
jgi:hypothetical protein